MVLITGAGSGIGRLMALEFAKLQCKVVLCDVNEGAAQETSKLIRTKITTAKPFVYACNVADKGAVYE